jgi:hypothetical protein
VEMTTEYLEKNQNALKTLVYRGLVQTDYRKIVTVGHSDFAGGEGRCGPGTDQLPGRAVPRERALQLVKLLIKPKSPAKAHR